MDTSRELMAGTYHAGGPVGGLYFTSRRRMRITANPEATIVIPIT
jgi:hypothetical protein